MPAGAACGEHDLNLGAVRAHSSTLPGKRRRVSASNMPTPSATATIDRAAIGDERRGHTLGRHQVQGEAIFTTACKPKLVTRPTVANQGTNMLLSPRRRARQRRVDEGE